MKCKNKYHNDYLIDKKKCPTCGASRVLPKNKADESLEKGRDLQ